MPPTSKAIFYDGKKHYYKGIPPFSAIDKEISNAMNGAIVYTMTDNRILSRDKKFVPHPVRHPEKDLMSLANAIARQSGFLNLYVINYNERIMPTAPEPIKPPEASVPNLSKMKLPPPTGTD